MNLQGHWKMKGLGSHFAFQVVGLGVVSSPCIRPASRTASAYVSKRRRGSGLGVCQRSTAVYMGASSLKVSPQPGPKTVAATPRVRF